MNINLNSLSWQFSIFILIGLLFFIWLIFGGGDHEYIGLNPLKIGYDASRCKNHNSDEENIEQSIESVEQSGELIDNTPPLPDLSNVETKTRFCPSCSNSFSTNLDEPSVGNLLNSSFRTSETYSESKSYSEEDIKSPENIKSPRTLSLGRHCEYKNIKKSKGELLCKQAIEEIYGKPFYCVRPDFLKNPETGRNLEIDLYNDELKIGVEYSGSQHSVYPNTFHKTYEEFLNQVRRDIYKVDACDANEIYLITVPYNVPLNLEAIKKYITYYLPENAHLRKNYNEK